MKPISMPDRGKTLLGNLWAEAKLDEALTNDAQVKALKRVWGKRCRKPSGRRYELLESIKQAEITLGHGCVRLDHAPVREAIEDAIRNNDWHFLYILSRWHEKERKPLKPDALTAFIWKHWETCPDAKGGWKGLRDLDDQGIALWAKARGIGNRAFGKRGKPFEGESAVKERRLALSLERGRDARFTFRVVQDKLVVQRLMQ